MHTTGALAGAHNTDARNAIFNDVGRDQHNHNINTFLSQADDKEKWLASLKPVYRGGYYVLPCMEGTRQGVFKTIDKWLHDTDQPNILWLHGSPGCVALVRIC